MADGSTSNELSLNSAIMTKPFSLHDAHDLQACLLAMHSLAQVIQAAATGDADMKDSGIYGTAVVLEQQANRAFGLLGL